MYIGSFAVISGEVAILQRRRCFHVDQVVVELACLLEEHFVAYRSRGPSVPGERPKSSEIEESTRSLFPNSKFWISDYHLPLLKLCSKRIESVEVMKRDTLHLLADESAALDESPARSNVIILHLCEHRSIAASVLLCVTFVKEHLDVPHT